MPHTVFAYTADEIAKLIIADIRRRGYVPYGGVTFDIPRVGPFVDITLLEASVGALQRSSVEEYSATPSLGHQIEQVEKQGSLFGDH